MTYLSRLTGVFGFEPKSYGLEPFMLPLHHTPIIKPRKTRLNITHYYATFHTKQYMRHAFPILKSRRAQLFCRDFSDHPKA